MEIECKARKRRPGEPAPKPKTQKEINDLLKRVLGLDLEEEARKQERARERRRQKRIDKIFEKTVLK